MADHPLCEPLERYLASNSITTPCDNTSVPIRVIELFAGVGGFRIGLERASRRYRTLWSNQWEPSTKKQDASEIYRRWFGADGHSNEDVCTVGVERIPEADMVVGGFPCLTGDTRVSTLRGQVPLRDIVVGDMVLSHDRTYRRVAKVFNQGVRDVYDLWTASGLEVVATGNHRFATFGRAWLTVDEIRRATTDIYLACMDDGHIPYFDKVVSVKAFGREHVYDIEVEGTHTFIANHLVTHNCQDYSVASTLNRSGGIEGKKGVLWWQIHRILCDSVNPPSYLFFENVDRLLNSPTHRRGRDFAIILASLSDLGYSVEWRIVNAADYGMPQRRRRTYIVAYREGTPLQAESMSVDARTWILRDGILASALPCHPTTGLGVPMYVDIVGDLATVTRDFNKDGKDTPFLSAGYMVGRHVCTLDVAPVYCGPHVTLGDLLVPESEVPSEYFIADSDIPRWKYLKGPKREKRTAPNGFEYVYSEGAMAFPDNPDLPSRTIITGEGGKGPSRTKHAVLTESGRYRRLVPVELERLNMFPDGHTEGVPAAKRAFLMGNALVTGIVVAVGHALADRI